MNLYDPGTLKTFLGRHGISAAKGLGQHFLVSRSVVDKIVQSLSGCEGIIEIGPGPGVLTGPISLQASRMIALEIDERMIAALAESAPKADVRQLDALKSDLSSLLQELPEPRGVVSNLPYYITGPLLTRIAESRRHYSIAVLMMQKEVGERVLAGPKTPARGSLSVFLQAQFNIERVAVAPAGAFLPPPKVDSIVLSFTPRLEEFEDEAWFFKVVRVGFTQPRKTLVNNLGGLGCSREQITTALEQAELGPLARPQELNLEQWRNLAAKLKR
ncbi:MAG TPA: 16S rRNA (adenine(1518)-N(6)/adenine(1519)-N(6))-dimethyltransferase RsmA [Fimbriimonas sp.]|nr:16S rRNA (adenine(1518)-N(6)/adenine(1519)-N(6))-dimethyltransferase RsmA [Fimbriimonas sp.]